MTGRDRDPGREILRRCRSGLRSILKTILRQPMKRKRAILSLFVAVAGRPGFLVGLVAGTLMVSGCARFERDWRRAVGPGVSGASGTSGKRGGGMQEGAWTGTWTSPGTGHSGKLRCVIGAAESTADGAAVAEAAFTYHATWSIFSGTFPTRQPVQLAKDGSVRSIGTWTLPGWAGGRYDYDMTIRGNRCTGTWKSARDSGSLEMARAVAEVD